MPHVNKKTTSEKWKFGSNKKLGLERTMNGLRTRFRKKSDPKVRHESEIAECEQKPLARKHFFSNTVFSLFFKIRAKKFHAVRPLAFSLHFLFRRD